MFLLKHEFNLSRFKYFASGFFLVRFPCTLVFNHNSNNMWRCIINIALMHQKYDFLDSAAGLSAVAERIRTPYIHLLSGFVLLCQRSQSCQKHDTCQSGTQHSFTSLTWWNQRDSKTGWNNTS